MPKPKTKDLARKGTETTAQRVKMQMRETAGRDVSPESYGGDIIEDSAQYVADSTADGIREMGSSIKDKAMEQIKERIERVRQREDVPDSGQSSPQEPQSGRSYSEPRTDPHTRPQDRHMDAKPDPAPDRSPRQRPEGAERIKTKDSYSQKLSEDVKWGFRKSFAQGKAYFGGRFYGYRMAGEGKVEIIPEQAEIVKQIFQMYLDGSTSRKIAQTLTRRGVLNASGNIRWDSTAIDRMLANEKYMGDALSQKTFIADVLEKKPQKNTGQLPQYYVTDNHEAIIPREMFKRVQFERARRGSLEPKGTKTKTNAGRFRPQYVLTEILLCGECGEHYRRCTWARNGKKRWCGGASTGWRTVSATAGSLPRWTRECCTTPSSDFCGTSKAQGMSWYRTCWNIPRNRWNKRPATAKSKSSLICWSRRTGCCRRC